MDRLSQKTMAFTRYSWTTVYPRTVGLLLPVPILDTISIVLCLIAFVSLMTYITDIFVKLFERIYVIFGNVGVLAVKNLRNNKGFINNITLLAIGIATVLVTNIANGSVIKEIINVFSDTMRYQITVSLKDMDKGFESQVRAVEGVTGTYKQYIIENVEVDNTNSRITVLQGINKEKHLDYYNLQYSGEPKELMEQLGKGRNIILANMLKIKLNVEYGDSVTIKVNDKKMTYKIIGFMNTLVYNGDYAIISEKFFKTDIGENNYCTICIRSSGDPEKTADLLKMKFGRQIPDVTVMKDIADEIMRNNKSIFTILDFLSIMTAVIGIFGIMNNLIISFIERKRSLAIYRSTGMEKKQIVRMILMESFSVGFIGGGQQDLLWES
jgi:putative ABC transport system permease protein